MSDKALLVAASAVAGVASGAAPTGARLPDLVLVAGVSAVVTLAGRRARRWSMVPVAAVGLAFGAVPVGFLCGVVALLVATRANMRRQATPVLGTIAGGFGVQALLRLDIEGAHGLETILAVLVVIPLLVSGFQKAQPVERTRVKQALTAGLLVSGTLLVVTMFSVVSARTSLDRGQQQMKDALHLARTGETGEAATLLASAAESFSSSSRSLSAPWAQPARMLPVVSQNLQSMDAAAAVVADVAKVGAEVLEDSAADELEVRGGAVPVEALAALEEPLMRVEDALAAARRQLAGSGSAWDVRPVQSRLRALDDRLDEAQHDSDVALGAVRTLPSFFGSGGVRHYLVLFVTPVEGRASGFPGNYAELTITDGAIDMTRFGRVQELEQDVPSVLSLAMPPEFDERYARFGTTWRNITLSPHFPTVAELARQLYPQSGGGPIDGVLSVDPAALADLLRLTGPIKVPGLGRQLTSRNAEQFLLRDQYVDLPDTPDRADALESLGRATFDALLEDDLPTAQQISKVLSPAFAEQHLRVVSFDPAVGSFLDSVGLSGALTPITGDSLEVTTNNAIGNKVDLFLERSIDYRARWNPDTRNVDSVLTVHLVNTAPSRGLPDYVIGNAINHDDGIPLGTNRTYLSVFTPLGLESATLNGLPISMESHVEQGRRVYSRFVDIGPDGGSTTLELVLTGPIVGEGGYHLDLTPQVLAHPDRLHVEVAEGGQNVLVRALEAWFERTKIEQ